MIQVDRAWSIYALVDPRTDAIRYVGWTSKSLESRLGSHLRSITRKDRPTTHRVFWIRSLIAVGLKPTCRLLETGAGPGWADAERRWIRELRAAGADLTNATDGGDGLRNYRVSPETRLRLSAASKGRTYPPEVRARMGAGKIGKHPRPFSAEARANMSRGQAGKTLPPEHRAKISASNRGKIRKLSESGLGVLIESGKRLSGRFNANRPISCLCGECHTCKRRLRRAFVRALGNHNSTCSRCGRTFTKTAQYRYTSEGAIACRRKACGALC